MGYRIVRDKSIIWPRSACPHCHHQLYWYDLIPILSWVVLQGSCRYCSQSISFLYPCIEILTALLLTTLYCMVPLHYFSAYFFFFSALIVTIRSDIETMLISRYVTFFLIPAGFIFSSFKLLPISLSDSIAGSVLGYLFLWVMARGFYWFTKKEGIGQGDFELLSFIGSFLGALGVWVSLFLGATIGTIIGILYIVLFRASRGLKIPFGPFLALGAFLFVFFQDYLLNFFTF